ncbi:M20 family dipeptidase [Puniceicoccales bacterium CK1056]|uniref:M20 family dipeptidase n=1 Tax=Oceanipulchritudo coccoides TaxID=2706888 RepID=A0A6B2M2Q8_9BACT|nr:M20/M25/M40 family metallo-hydrolase [Oceanipulchritudo coccoides]NDV62479.1 M20 family dipeptidase [Oceanipulchritudo coccoides]
MFDPIEVIKELVSNPSVSTDSAYADGMQGTRDVLTKLFSKMSLEVEVVDTPRHPVVLARRNGPDSWPHVIIYGHYDVQPPDPLDLWDSPAFEPTMRGTRLYGRGVADNKGPMMVHVTAVARLLEEKPDLPLRITFLIEGEEEIGSPSLPMVLESHGESLRGDFVLLSDTLNPSEDQVAINMGLRGIVSLEIEVSGPSRDLHSGGFGGAIYNPLQALTEICASLHHPDGRINVPGFYDDVILPADWEKEEIAKLPSGDEELRESTGVPGLFTANNRTGMEAIRYEPTLEINGIGGGYQGEGDKTIIPSKAFAKITCRLVANQDPDDIQKKVFAAIRERCPKEVRLNIKEGHDGMPYSVVPPGRSNTPADQNPHLAKAFKACEEAVEKEFGLPPLYLRGGGSIPIIGEINKVLGLDCIMLGMGTEENNLHSPNESFNVASLEKGIAVSKAILLAVADK